MRPADREKLQRLDELLRQRELAPMTNYSWWFGFWYHVKWFGYGLAYLIGVLWLMYLVYLAM